MAPSAPTGQRIREITSGPATAEKPSLLWAIWPSFLGKSMCLVVSDGFVMLLESLLA